MCFLQGWSTLSKATYSSQHKSIGDGIIGKNQDTEIDYEKATQQISMLMELADAEREDEYLRNWNALGEDDKPKLDKERSSFRV